MNKRGSMGLRGPLGGTYVGVTIFNIHDGEHFYVKGN